MNAYSVKLISCLLNLLIRRPFKGPINWEGISIQNIDKIVVATQDWFTVSRKQIKILKSRFT